MSIQAVAWVLERSKVKLGARLVLIAIANHADERGDNCWPSIELLAREAGMTARQVYNVMPKLVESGELEILRGMGPRGVHRYRILPLAQKGLWGDEEIAPEKSSGVKNRASTPEISCTEGVKSFQPNRPRTFLEPSSVGTLDPEAWERYESYRREIRKPIKPVSMLAAQRRLAGFGADQKAVVEQTIACGWIRLDAVKGTKPPAAGATPSSRRLRSAEDTRAVRLRAAENLARQLAIEGMRADETLEQFEHRVGRAQLDALGRGRKKASGE
jgi:hypothetical protein